MTQGELASSIRVRAGSARATRWPRRRAALLLGQCLVVVAVLVIWAVVHAAGLLSEDVLPAVSAVGAETVRVLGMAEFWAALGWTVLVTAVALVLSLALGIPVGILLGVAPPVRRAVQVVFDFCRSFPVIALLPLMALLLGTNLVMEIAIVTLALVWAVIAQAIDGSRRLDPVIADTVRAYRIGRSLEFWKVTVPNAAPYLMTGIRIAATAALLVAVAVELITQLPGLGGQISRAQQYQVPALALAYVVYAGLVAVLVNALLWRIERRLLPWSSRAVAR